jgi:hypothetical protein
MHHVGIITNDFNLTSANYNVSRSTKVYWDEKQQAEILFLDVGSSTLIELIRPLNEKSQTYKFLMKGGGLHHTCFFSPSKEMVLIEARKNKFIQLTGFLPAVAFDEKEIVFFATKDNQIIEYVISDVTVDVFRED